MCYKALADLGASVSVMPYSTYITLGLGDLSPTKLIVELTDRTVKRPKGIAENALVARQFDGMITIYNGNDEVTYQMVRSHPRFKHQTNVQCNKIPLLLKVNEKDKMNGISYAYQKLKGFYTKVLNLRPDYIRDAMTKEWLSHSTLAYMRWNYEEAEEKSNLKTSLGAQYAVPKKYITPYRRSSIRRTQEVQYIVPEELNTPYPRSPIHQTEGAQYAISRKSDTPYPIRLKKILEYFFRGAYAKRPRYAISTNFQSL
nr:hypothetical protein [Tanacetum cinerariifolium]